MDELLIKSDRWPRHVGEEKGDMNHSATLHTQEEKGQMSECMVFDDHIVVFGTNQETGLGEVRIVPTTDGEHDRKMRNLCIDMIFEAGCECSLLDAVHSAAEVLGTPKDVLKEIIVWAGFDPMD